MRRVTAIFGMMSGLLLAGCAGRPEDKIYVGQGYAEAQRAARAAGFRLDNAAAFTGTAEPEGFSLALPQDGVLLVFRQGDRVALMQQVGHASQPLAARTSFSIELFRLRR